MSDVPITTQYISELVKSGQLTSTMALQEAVDEQTNTATSGTNAQPVNQAWGQAIPRLFGHTLTAGLPLWVGNFQQTTDTNGNTVTQVDMAALFGRGAPGYTDATLLQVYLDDSQVWGIADPSITQPSGAPLDFTFYNGLENVPDPTIAAGIVSGLNGVNAQCPAFAGMMYIVLRNIVVDSVSADATTSVPSVTLPQVRANIVQQHADANTDVMIYGFVNAPEDNPTVTQCVYDPIKHRMIHLLDDLGAVDIYDLDNARYIGRTKLLGYTIQPNSYASCNYLWLDEMLVVSSRGPTRDTNAATGFWNIDTGTLLNDKNNPATGVPRPFGDARGFGADCYQPAPGKLIVYYGDDYLVDISDINNVVALQQIPYSANHNCMGDYPFDTSDIGTGCKIYYYTNFSANALYIVADCGLHAQEYGLITWNGSKQPIYMYPNIVTYNGRQFNIPQISLFTFVEPTAQIKGVYCDPVDSRFVYLLVAAAGGLSLRRYGNFFYFNPQKGGKPPAQNPVFSNWDVGVEVQRLALPPFEPFAGTQSRDRRAPYIANSDHDTLYIINMRNLTYNSYFKGVWHDAQGFHTSGWKTFQTDSCYLSKFRAFTYYSQTDLPIYEQAGFGVPDAALSYSVVYTLAQMFLDLSLLAGYTQGQIECDNLDDEIGGMQLNQNVKFTDLIQQLAAAFRVDIIETPTGGLKFQRKPSNSPADIAPDVFSLLPLNDDGDDTHVIDIDRVTTNELPRVLQLSFISVDFGFVVGSVTVKRTTYPIPTQYGPTSLALSVPVVMSNANAAYFAGLAIFDMWAGQTNFTIKLPPKFIQVEVGDFLQLTRPSGRVNLCKVTQIDLGQDRTITVTLSSINTMRPVPLFQGATAPSQSPPALAPLGTLTTPQPDGTYVSVVDNVSLEPGPDAADNSIPLYFMASTVADVYLQPDDNSTAPVKIGTTAVTPIGTCASILGTLSPFRLDNNPIILAGLTASQLPPIAANWRDGGNAILIGVPGRWELIYYGGAVDTPAGLSLSPVLRGRRGTDAYTQAHGANDLAVVVPATLLRTDLPFTALNRTYRVFGMPPGARPGPYSGVFGTFNVSGLSLAPFSPGDIQARLDDRAHIIVTWHRRDRGALPSSQGDAWWTDPPQSDGTPQFVVTIGQSTYRVYGTTFDYNVQQQQADGNVGAKRLRILVQQVGTYANSAAVGGYINVGQ